MNLESEIKKLANTETRKVLLGFFKTGKGEYGYGDKFLGVRVPQIRALVKKDAHEYSFKEVQNLISSPFHEIRLAGLFVLCRKFQLAKDDEPTQTKCVETYLANTRYINNWDLVDLTCYELLGTWLLNRDRTILYQMTEPNRGLWENRIAIVTTMQFIRHNQFDDTFAIADKLLTHPHDLIHKSVGWLLREVGKRNQELLEVYLKPRYKTMPRTMLRYAIERFDPCLRELYLKGKI